MKEDKSYRPDRRYASWAALCVLSLLAAMVFAVPSVVFAQITGELSQECDFALIGTEHTITAKVTEGGAPGATVPTFFYSTDPDNYGTYKSGALSFDENGIATFTYMVDSVGQVDISLLWVKQDGSYDWVTLDAVTTTWTSDDQDLLSCMEPSAQTVNVGGHGKLNVKKKGAMRIMVCSDGELDLFSVDPETVTLAGVKPERWKYKDIRYCAGGKDGFVDLVFKFKNRKIVEALEGVLARELVDDDKVELDLAGSLDDGTPLEGTYAVEIIKKDKKAKRCKKKKMAKK